MSKIHILESQKGDRVRVAFHLDVPAGSNQAPRPWSDCLREYLPQVSAVPGLSASDAAHHAAIQAGTVYEHIEAVEFDGNASNAAKVAIVDARHAALQAAFNTRIQSELRFWGMTRNP